MRLSDATLGEELVCILGLRGWTLRLEGLLRVDDTCGVNPVSLRIDYLTIAKTRPHAVLLDCLLEDHLLGRVLALGSLCHHYFDHVL